MPAGKPKGYAKTGGRKKGVGNKSTQETREAIAKFVANNVPRFEEWLERVALDNPAKAMELTKDLIEYHIPKLQRTELAQDKDNPVQITIKYPEEEK